MKTYAEKEGQETFDWNEFLNRKRRSKEQWAMAESLALSWVTCACGNICEIIPRAEDGRPLDTDLNVLGVVFYLMIKDKKIKAAKETLEKIEARSTELILEIQS